MTDKITTEEYLDNALNVVGKNVLNYLRTHIEDDDELVQYLRHIMYNSLMDVNIQILDMFPDRFKGVNITEMVQALRLQPEDQKEENQPDEITQTLLEAADIVLEIRPKKNETINEYFKREED